MLSYLVNIAIALVLLLSTTMLPGSQNHDYVMYEICFPAMKKYYGVPDDQGIPSGPMDKNGWGKWWYQHSECETNVYDGKGPIFSENPPGFVPVNESTSM